MMPGPAAAHDRTTSYSSWILRQRHAEVTVRLAELDVSRLPPETTAGAELASYLARHLQLFAGDTPCTSPAAPRRIEAAPGRLAFEWALECPPAGALRMRSNLLLDVAPSHLHFARLSRPGGSPHRGEPQEHLFSDAERTWQLDDGRDGAAPSPDAEGGTSLLDYVVLGIEHILGGYDHLAFLLALLLIGGGAGEVARVVTGFTVAHSITLGLTVLGYVRPDTAPVEALIGLSIALVATENVWLLGPRDRGLPLAVAATLTLLAVAAAAGWGRVPSLTLGGLGLFSICYFEILRRRAGSASVRWAVAFLFGLVHGFGFASVLGEAGLPAGRVAQALFGFNAGVEIGQLAVVALVWPVLRRALRRGDGGLRLVVVEAGSAAVLGLGVFWFVTRAFG